MDPRHNQCGKKFEVFQEFELFHFHRTVRSEVFQLWNTSNFFPNWLWRGSTTLRIISLEPRGAVKTRIRSKVALPFVKSVVLRLEYQYPISDPRGEAIYGIRVNHANFKVRTKTGTPKCTGCLKATLVHIDTPHPQQWPMSGC